MSKTITKPWGSYEDFYRDYQVVMKRIIIAQGQSISYQVHSKRSEFWYIAAGKGQFKFGPESAPLENYSVSTVIKGQTVEIAAGMAHQIKNIGNDSLIIFEMQYGECSEEDITRLDDPYKRV